jgi:hypothetical protein
MAGESWLERLVRLDIRVWSAIIATVLLVGGVMWVIPTTPTSSSFTFETARRDAATALPILLDLPLEGTIIHGSDAEFYRLEPLKTSYRLDVLLTNRSDKMIPGIRIFDAANNLIQDRSPEFVRRPGATIETSFLAQSNMTYYIQVFSQRNTTGPYTISVKMR